MDIISRDSQNIIYKYQHNLHWVNVMKELLDSIHFDDDESYWHGLHFFIHIEEDRQENKRFEKLYQKRIDLIKKLHYHNLFNGKMSHSDQGFIWFILNGIRY